MTSATACYGVGQRLGETITATLTLSAELSKKYEVQVKRLE